MSTITAILEADADGTLHLPLPAELRHGKIAVTARVEPVGETAQPDAAEMARRRAAAMDAFKRLREANPYFEIADPVAWQRKSGKTGRCRSGMCEMLLDTNILIYLSKPGGEAIQEVISATRPVASIVSKIEAYGYHRITEQEISDLNVVFGWVEVLPVSDEIAERAILLRQKRNMKLGDAIIAATALVYGVPVCTRNVPDFKHVADLQILNPFTD